MNIYVYIYIYIYIFFPFSERNVPSVVVALCRGIKMIFMRGRSSAFDNFIMDFSGLYIIDGVERTSRVKKKKGGEKSIDSGGYGYREFLISD